MPLVHSLNSTYKTWYTYNPHRSSFPQSPSLFAALQPEATSLQLCMADCIECILLFITGTSYVIYPVYPRYMWSMENVLQKQKEWSDTDSNLLRMVGNVEKLQMTQDKGEFEMDQKAANFLWLTFVSLTFALGIFSRIHAKRLSRRKKGWESLERKKNAYVYEDGEWIC